ncbi:hypothetical protein [Arthrobacter sp. NIO-1057]|uniref:hypothetical protein n=1 Tax=Arthrobacter sp. NIO-1057 TaxID=993071 RepID=UPI00071D2B73|nr:hypothetical protein [Arthrobacter sp. NIO-1057]KSU66052.1 hypothetical protein AS038_10270 [Arthrobacter sp. NIO-1057]SCC30942.1 hypothetical protein GA0061084_2092 [Arthrobacter sp. NIO-1057]
MDTNSAPSLLTKELSDLSLNDVLLVSLVIAGIVLAVVLSFGVKTYLHLRKTAKAEIEDEVTVDAPKQLSAISAPATSFTGGQHSRRAAMPGGLRNSAPAMSKFENGN